MLARAAGLATSSMRVRSLEVRWLTYAVFPSGWTTTPRGSRATSSVQITLRAWRSTPVAWWVHAEVTTATVSSRVTASPHASAGRGMRASSLRLFPGSSLKTRRRPGSRIVTSTYPSRGRTCAGAPGTEISAWRASGGGGFR